MKFNKIQPKIKQKVSYTYFLPDKAIALEYLTKYCENLRMRKVDILDEALTKLFQKEKKYSKELETERYKEFKKEFENNLLDKK